MKINIKGLNANMCGLTLKNLRHPAVQNFLSTQGMTVLFEDSETAIISSTGPICIDRAFQKKVKELELLPVIEAEYSWTVLNGFIAVLGAAAIAISIALLYGATAAAAVSIGFVAGGAALAVYGLFCVCTQEDCMDPGVNELASGLNAY